MKRCTHGVMLVEGDNPAQYCTVCTPMNTVGWDWPQVRSQDFGLTDSDYDNVECATQDDNDTFNEDGDDDDEY